MPRPASFTGKIIWKRVRPEPGVPAWETILYSEARPQEDASKIFLAAPHAAKYLGISKNMIEPFLVRHRDAAIRYQNAYFYPLSWLDKTVRLFLPKEPLIHSRVIRSILGINKMRYWELWRQNKFPTFRFGRKTYLTYSNLLRYRLNLPIAEKPRLFTF